MNGTPSPEHDQAAEDRLEAVAAATRTGVLEDTAARIGLAVELGLLRPDEQLPREGELAATFGVSRMTVRRALKKLSDRGVVMRRRGRGGGTFVASVPPPHVLREFQAYRTENDEVFDLIRYRLVLECGNAFVAARLATPSDIVRLRTLVRDMDDAESWVAFRAIDPLFHLAVAAIAGSPDGSRSLAATLGTLLRYYLPYPISYLHESNREHAALVDAIEAKDGAAAAVVAERHISELFRTAFVAPEGVLGPAPRAASARSPSKRFGVAGRLPLRR